MPRFHPGFATGSRVTSDNDLLDFEPQFPHSQNRANPCTIPAPPGSEIMRRRGMRERHSAWLLLAFA